MTTPTIAPSTSAERQAPAGSLRFAMPAEELLYEARLRITGVTEYGVTLADITSGTAPIPPEGIRLDVAFEGTIAGPKLAGTGTGMDYALIRADGRIELHIHARIGTADGANIAMVGDGTGSVGASGLVEIREAVRLHTSDPRYRWVNTLAPWGSGTVDFTRREIHVWSSVAEQAPPKP